MTGWNLPPGCNVRDIPGNGPEDPVAEKLNDLLLERLGPLIDENHIDGLWTKIMELVDDARREAYSQGQADTSLADHYNMELALIDLAFRGLATTEDGKWIITPKGLRIKKEEEGEQGTP